MNFSNGQGQGDLPENVRIPEIKETTYRELYRLADWMWQSKPWEEMYDFHTFVVRNPDAGTDQLAVVLGHSRSVFALHLYLPEEGLRWRTRVGIEGSSPFSAHQAQFDNRYLSVEFVGDDDLDDHDMELDDQFAPDAWVEGSPDEAGTIDSVVFRSVLPGCPPWHPTEEEAQAMIDGLRLLRRYFEEYFEEYEWASFSPEPDEPLELPTFRLPAKGQRSDPAAWEFSLTALSLPGPKELPAIPVDELFLTRLSRLKTKAGTRWELGSLFSPAPTFDEGRPIYPVIAFTAVTESRRAEGASTAHPDKGRALVMRESFSKTAEAVGYLPAEVAVGSPIAEIALKELAAASGMRILGGGVPIPFFDELAEEMMQSFGFTGEGPDGIDFEALDPGDLAEIDQLMRDAPGEDASEEELVSFMDRLLDTGAGSAALKPLIEGMASGGPPGEPGVIPGPTSRKKPATPAYRPPSDRERYLFRIDLVGAKPPIWRRISIPIDATFFDLHLAIQAAFDWEGDHPHSFEKRVGGRPELIISWQPGQNPHTWAREMARELETPLSHFFRPANETINYLYDGDNGDEWDHKIKLEKIIRDPSSEEVPMVEVLKGKGANPIEGSGGMQAHLAILAGDPDVTGTWPADRIDKIRQGHFDPDEVRLRDPREEIARLERLSE